MIIITTTEEWNSILPRYKWKLMDFIDLQECFVVDYFDDEIKINIEVRKDTRNAI